MSKRIRYEGPYPVVIVEVLPGITVEVAHGGQLPTEVEGESVPATVRDGLAGTNDWSEATTSSSAKKEN